MRDIGSRIQRYRLSRYAHAAGGRRLRLHWLWILALGWIAWAGLLSEHSFYRIWRLSAETERTQHAIEDARAQTAALEAEHDDPELRRERIEKVLRQRMARPDEIVYKVLNTPIDSLPR